MFEEAIIYDDNEFVSIDLNDDKEECNICHQITDEKTISVILSDEFTLFEGTYDKYDGGLTNAHQLCLQKWADIIERNIKFSSSRTKDPSYIVKSDEMIFERNNTDENIKAENTKKLNSQENNTTKKLSTKNLNDKNNEKIQIFENLTQNELNSLSLVQLKEKLNGLNDIIEKLSTTLVDELQCRDKLNQETSAQKSLIEQLVSLQKKRSGNVALKKNYVSMQSGSIAV